MLPILTVILWCIKTVIFTVAIVVAVVFGTAAVVSLLMDVDDPRQTGKVR